MRPTLEDTIELSAEDLLAPADDCFEVEDIAALDPIAAPGTVAAAANPPANPHDQALEIELSADDIDDLLDSDAVVVTFDAGTLS